MTSLSIRDLQKMSAERIRALRRPTAIRSNGELVGWLNPVPEVPPVDIEKMRVALETIANSLTDEEKRALEEGLDT